MSRTPQWLVIGLLAAAVAGCGRSSISDAERQLGAEQHPQLLAEFGGAYKGEEAAYVASLGGRLATAAGLDRQCTFTLVNSDVVNAFAVPGCYIYVTRGLMAIVNSEAELASVLAHEIGHIAADHSERQQKRSLWRSLGVLAIGTLTGSRELTELVGTAATYFSLRYSRKHEYEADDLGLGYMRELGYDPFAAVDMLAALEREHAFRDRTRGTDEARSIPEWAMTHPLTENRIERAREAASDDVASPDALPENEAAYLRHADGLLYGDDPQQGFVFGRRFEHPVMRIAFAAPPGFALTNSPEAILIEGPEGTRGEFSGGAMPPGGLDAYADAVLGAVLGDTPVEIAGSARTRINGVPALLVEAAVATRDGMVPLALAVYEGGEASAYHFLIISHPGRAYPAGIEALFASFRLLSDDEVAALRPRFLRVTTVRREDTLKSLASRMASDRPLEHFLVLNGRSRAAPPRVGEKVKLIVWGR